jgi:hypothetical protein
MDIFKARRAKIVEKIYIIMISMCRVPLPALAKRPEAQIGRKCL